uniref:ATP synthase F0 subunit 8 n=1 Tax=Cricotopus flavozonatus TaxID=1667274 RepID=UPI002E79C7BA|nr:ATP synthase F0 subunit 8 [Cricotopus flavozonatus]WPM93104.1 ATP synthase F0 subunit 8 [Cricotopus flavozonatus]
MPQMAPISWLILFIVFSIAFMLFNVLNYYCFNYNKTSTSNDEKSVNKFNTVKLNWKW